MDEVMRISVRELVAFSFFQADILPAADASAMLAGTRAHQARQAQTDAQIEKSIKHVYEVDGLRLLVFGRMDACIDGDVPLIEEIKLAHDAPSSPLPEHRAQALCYAAMLALEKPCGRVRFSVCYVEEGGRVLASFEEEHNVAELSAEMDDLLKPYAAFAQREQRHRMRRDETLRAMPFPFDGYRKGQRELAVQVYTAISRRKRLFASLPTGTGKSAAVLFPALKALGEGKADQVLYLTARNTARQSPLNALQRMTHRGMKARCCVLTAKEKLCPAPTRCHPDWCSRARGHYVRQQQAIDDLLKEDVLLWDDQTILQTADRHHICPFELALALTELADVVMMDLNYVFDPFAQIKRLSQRKAHSALLVDEAHHIVERVRESLSGSLNSRDLAHMRAEYGKQFGRKNGLYQALGEVIKAIRAIESDQDTLDAIPDGLTLLVQKALDEAIERAGEPGVQDMIRLFLPFLYAAEHLDEDYAILTENHGRERTISLYCLLPGKEIARLTKGMRGAVFFSATLQPLEAMKQLLGGNDDDACFALPSPFPPENLAVIRKGVCTRYERREQSAPQIAQAISDAVQARPGNWIAFFPSYAYMNLVLSHMNTDHLPPLWIQQRDMTEEDRQAFLEAFDQTDAPRLGLCVLGGLFSEGVDLPGEKLVGAAIVGVGLPVPSAQVNAVRACYQRHFGDGFAFACRFPGMHKVLQAAGRVIRSETDRGMVLLLDERYFDYDYAALLPPQWRMHSRIADAAKQLEECK
ncbi:MAG: helicase C-terminal domain-containing protein [bacterium]|nr:helicase C-terminal domain-containing protein [bacterium]